jgi:anhydro-N-acetylmuramic acid kinase
MQRPSELYVGLMTGTSLDAVDAALVSFSGESCTLSHTLEHPLPVTLRDGLLKLIDVPQHVSLDELGSIDRKLGLLYADAVKQLLSSAGIEADSVQAIGCHGQTIRHQPNAEPAFTLQIGDAATLATATGIQTVADFRSADIALGGQGAPLAPLFHQWWLRSIGQTGAVVNIGGIANISVIANNQPLIGFDTGPGNTLLDLWCQASTGESFDRNGDWAAQGHVIPELLNTMLQDDYLQLQPPKSTGREYFNRAWLNTRIADSGVAADARNIQATLSEFTAVSIANAAAAYAPHADIWLCGGGTANADLVRRIQSHRPESSISPTDQMGIPAAWIEAAAFAWLARARMNNQPTDTPSVTGASRATVLGAVHYPTKA